MDLTEDEKPNRQRGGPRARSKGGSCGGGGGEIVVFPNEELGAESVSLQKTWGRWIRKFEGIERRKH